MAGDCVLAAHLRADGREGPLRVPAAVFEGGGGHFEGDGADVGQGGEGGWVLVLEGANAVDGAVGGAHGCVAVNAEIVSERCQRNYLENLLRRSIPPLGFV